MENIIGRKLDGRYEIQEILGIGGMAIVYKAYDSIDDRTVAVKVLKQEYLTNEDFRRRFKNESKAVAVLSHPNIVKVYDVSLGEKLQYIVMEYIDGITLKEYMDQQHVLSWKETVHFTVQILRALMHAHEKGIVHRDIKPQNIMMLEDGTIKVADFGIARFANSETRTMTDKAIGSVHYISPEQARGAETDEKSDIYSVGVMLYEMLTGQLPFESENAVSVAIMQMQQEPKKPRVINPNIPEGLEDITMRAMQKDPLQRYASATQMLADIDEFKRNPSVHFEYKYFVDDSPTKFIDAINKVKGNPAPELAEKKPKEKKVSIIPILSGIAAAVLIVTLAIIMGVLWYLGFFNKNSNNVQAPNVVGLMYDNVTTDTSLTGKWIFTRVNQQYSDKAEGTIIEQNPKAGTLVKPNSTIKLTVSLGQKTNPVPNVVNNSASDAQVALINAGFTPVQQQMYSDDVAKGRVVKTEPAANTQAQSGSTVTYYVSQGPEVKYIDVPDLSKSTTSTVQSDIETKGFKLGNLNYAFSSSVAYGSLISQSPAANSTKQVEGSTIDVTFSSGSQPNTTVGNSLSTFVSTINSTNSHLSIVIINQLTNSKITVSSSNYSNYVVQVQAYDPKAMTATLTVTPKFPSATGGGLTTFYNNIISLGYNKANIYIIDSTGDKTSVFDPTKTYMNNVTSVTDSASTGGKSLLNTFVDANDKIYIHVNGTVS